MLNLPNVRSNVAPRSNQMRQVAATTVSLNNRFSCADKETGKQHKTYQQHYTGKWTKLPAVWSSSSTELADLDQLQSSPPCPLDDGYLYFQQYLLLKSQPLGCPSGDSRLTVLWETASEAPNIGHSRNINMNINKAKKKLSSETSTSPLN
jgi:hypothetical protein